MMVEYRKANMDDIDGLAQLRVRFLSELHEIADDLRNTLLENNKEYFHIAMKDESFVAWLAIDEGKIVATSGLSIYKLPPSTGNISGKNAYISNMYTVPEYRRKGVATKVFSLIVEEARVRGCERLLLNATDMGRPIYQEYGFEDSNSAMTFYPAKKSNS